MTTWAVALALLFAGLSQAAPIKTEHAEVELIAEKTALVVGEKNTIGLSIKHAPHWHTYWKNPGDSGYPTKITWQVPAGYGVGEFDWPTPKRLATGPIINFGYEGEVVLPLTVSVPTSAKPGDGITLKGKAEWLVCKDVCIPEEGEVAVTLPVGEKGKDAPAGPAAARFVAARAAQPGDASAWKATLYAAPNPTREVWLDVTAPANTGNLTGLDVFPVQEQISDPSVQQVYRTERGYAVKLKLVDGAKLTDSFPVLLAAVGAPVGAKGELSGNTLATVSTSAFALPAGATALAATGAASGATSGGTDLTFWSALALAFVGGMILNLMPCVFPVLSLKILSFAQHSGSAANGAKQMRQHGIFYAVGVVLSFLVLAGALLALKGAGSAVGWGFQLQNPGVVWVLAVIFFLIGLNLMGAFEVGQLAPSSLLSMQAKHPGVDAFFSGVLAVIAASPCTAPFMGAALGFALTQSAAAALAVFAALGLGMALPYVLLAWFPKWLDKLPRPGPWMVNFKQVLAFPMFVTVVWLVWVLSLQAGADGAAIGLLGLVGLAFGAWLIGSMRPTVRWVGVAAALVAAVLAWPAGEPAQTATSAATGKSGSANWQPWDPAAVAKLNAEGKPVFVDFTAAWCVSCQANKRLVLTRAEIEQAFAAKNVTLMRADWTNRDERITQALTAMGRSGVPVYVLHAPGKPAQLLPELLTTGIVKEALAAL
ncbi:protein-disulfide reductase DsbD family protein [Casimicrobium huifangae]|uniref:protein-disulfide reductase DsbD family protein n=1 Tax=Casimicrobium huifangae TaxID=2591109 RepID=UPI0013967DA7|nr:thioredoxin family protein [Casimicrobium huifangae]